MTDSLSDKELCALHGERLADVIDRRFATLQEEEVDLFIKQLRDQNLVGIPSRESLLRQLDEMPWVSLTRSSFEWEGDLWINVPRHILTYFELLLDRRPILLMKAYSPIGWALYNGRLTATGIREPEAENDWRRARIPHGVFEVGRYGVYRNGSRIAALDRNGKPEQAFNAVLLAPVEEQVDRRTTEGVKIESEDHTAQVKPGRPAAERRTKETAKQAKRDQPTGNQTASVGYQASMNTERGSTTQDKAFEWFSSNANRYSPGKRMYVDCAEAIGHDKPDTIKAYYSRWKAGNHSGK